MFIFDRFWVSFISLCLVFSVVGPTKSLFARIVACISPKTTSEHQMYDVGVYSAVSEPQLYSYSTEDTVRIGNSFITILNHT
jgi:hypothetical protein